MDGRKKRGAGRDRECEWDGAERQREKEQGGRAPGHRPVLARALGARSGGT
jgi:hypothetical protein